MTYTQNQFYKIKTYESDVGLTNPNFRNETDNPRFLWPSDTNQNTVAGQDIKISRGYMRLISTAFGKDYADLGKRRLHFQFNPETLSRNVTARNDVQMWMNQDPIQFTQPIPGDANFNFELIFNREQEVASGKYRTRTGSADGNNAYSAVIDDGSLDTGNVNSVYDPSAVTQLGVLSDLAVFDQLIGQGINKTLIEALANKAKKDIDQYNAGKKAEAKAAGVDVEDEAAVIPGKVEPNTENINQTLNLGVGNSAFIVSQPIRIVFSSLYMVEGFITSTNVTFDKFSPSMIPTQCRIAISMQAMYIGFAAKKTFLSDIYEDVQNTDYENGTTTPEGKAEVPELEKVGGNLWEAIFSTGETDISIGAYSAAAFPKMLAINADKSKDLELKIRLVATQDFKNWVKNFGDNGSVLATCEWLVRYYGQTGGTMLPANTGYDGSKAPIVFAARDDYDVSFKDVGTGKDTMEFKFTRPTFTKTSTQVPAKPNQGDWDQSIVAGALPIYDSKITITFTITGNSGATITADQMITGEYKAAWVNNVTERRAWTTSVMCSLKDTGGKDVEFDEASGQVN
jgi:hypothetical protein